MTRNVSIRLTSPLRGVRSSEIEITREEIPAPPAPVAKPSQEELIRGLLETLIENVRDLEARRQNSLEELQEAAIELAMAAASRIVRRAIDANELGCEEIVKEVLGRLAAPGTVRLALHPADLQLLQSSPAVTRDWSAQGIELHSEPGLTRGSCRATSGARTITSDWRTHLDEIRAALLEDLEHAQIERRGPEGTDQRVKRYPDRRETA